MPRHYHSSAAKCPYYRGECGGMVYCAGLYGAETLRSYFRDERTARVHRAKYCRMDWRACRIAQANDDAQERRENDI